MTADRREPGAPPACDRCHHSAHDGGACYVEVARDIECACPGSTALFPRTVPGAPPDPDLSTQHQPTGAIMDSSGRIHMLEQEAMDDAMRRSQQDRVAALERATLRHTGFVTKDPMPEKCDARRVLTVLDKIAEAWPGNEPVPESAAALAPLTPFERGYVLGVLAEYRTWRSTR